MKFICKQHKQIIKKNVGEGEGDREGATWLTILVSLFPAPPFTVCHSITALSYRVTTCHAAMTMIHIW